MSEVASFYYKGSWKFDPSVARVGEVIVATGGHLEIDGAVQVYVYEHLDDARDEFAETEFQIFQVSPAGAASDLSLLAEERLLASVDCIYPAGDDEVAYNICPLSRGPKVTIVSGRRLLAEGTTDFDWHASHLFSLLSACVENGQLDEALEM